MGTTEAKKITLYERAYQSIKDMIIKGQFAPEEKLKEIKLSEKLSISRTPVREALRKLEREGLVTISPSHGAEVTNLSKSTIKNLYHCRSVLEGLAVRQAAPIISTDRLHQIEESIILAENYFSRGDLEKVKEKNTFFHDQIVQSSNNAPLIQMMKNIRSQILRYRTLNGSLGFRKVFAKEHFEIYQAMANGRGEQAESLMKTHILGDLTAVLEGLGTIEHDLLD